MNGAFDPFYYKILKNGMTFLIYSIPHYYTLIDSIPFSTIDPNIALEISNHIYST